MIKEQQDNKFDQILRPGVNCWGLEDASHVSVIIDAADYFSAFAEASRAARAYIDEVVHRKFPAEAHVYR